MKNILIVFAVLVSSIGCATQKQDFNQPPIYQDGVYLLIRSLGR